MHTQTQLSLFVFPLIVLLTQMERAERLSENVPAFETNQIHGASPPRFVLLLPSGTYEKLVRVESFATGVAPAATLDQGLPRVHTARRQ